MNVSSILWIIVFCILVVFSFRRPSWGIALYLFVFYFSPVNWWWGRPLRHLFGIRFSLTAALIFAIAVFLVGQPRLRRPEGKVLGFLFLYALSGTIVHFLFAANPTRSADILNLLWKNLGLCYLLVTSIKDRRDWNIFLYSFIIGSLHVGYAVVFNNAGKMIRGRLELNFAPGIGDSNFLAGLLGMTLPLIFGLFFIGNRKEKLLAFISLPLVFDTLVRANSRGGFLGLIIGGAWFFMASRGRSRRIAWQAIFLSILILPFFFRDARIIERFKTTFASEEERETSAQSRIEYWKSGVRMLSDHPLGLGGEAAFKSDLGAQYIYHLREKGMVHVNKKITAGYRAIHNGYLDILCSWGIQSFILYALAHLVTFLTLRKCIRYGERIGDWKVSFFALCIQTGLIAFYVSSFFMSSLDGEWFFWMMAFSLGYNRIFGENSILNEEEENIEEESMDPNISEEPNYAMVKGSQEQRPLQRLN